MYEKWVHTWGIKDEAITEARKNMVGISGNKFKYLDSVLFSWHQKGIKTREDAANYYEKASHIKDFAKHIYGKVIYKMKKLVQ